MNTFYIAINNAPAVPARDLRLNVRSLEFENMASDVAALNWTRASPREVCPIEERDMVEVWLAGRRLFRGRARVGAIGHDGAPIRLLGVWQEFEEVPYQAYEVSGLPVRLGDTETVSYTGGETWTDGDGISHPYPSTVTYTYIADGPREYYDGTVATRNVNYWWTGSARLFPPYVGTTFLPVVAQLTQVLGMFALVADPLPYSAGETLIGTALGPKTRNVQDLSVAEAIRQALTPKPNAAVWFDYNVSGMPALYARTANYETPLELAVGEFPLRDYSLDALHDLVPTGVLVRWETPVTGYGPGLPVAVSSHPTGTLCYQNRVLLMTVAQEVNASAGLALQLYSDLSTLRSAGSLTLVDRDFSLGLRPGMVISLTGDAMQEGVEHWVQSVRWNPATGEAALEMGYPRHLSLNEWRDMRAYGSRVLMPPGYQPPQVAPLPS